MSNEGAAGLRPGSLNPEQAKIIANLSNSKHSAPNSHSDWNPINNYILPSNIDIDGTFTNQTFGALWFHRRNWGHRVKGVSLERGRLLTAKTTFTRPAACAN